MLRRAKSILVVLGIAGLMFAGTVSTFAASPAPAASTGTCIQAHAVMGPADAVAMHNAHHPDAQVKNFGELARLIKTMNGNCCTMP